MVLAETKEKEARVSLLYDCPNCGALEPGVHRANCCLAGLPVWQAYAPFDWSQAEVWLNKHLEDFKHKWPGRILLLNAEILEYKIFDSDKDAFDPDNPAFGPAPALGHHLMCQRL